MNRLCIPLLAAVCLMVPTYTVRSAPVQATRSGLEQVPQSAPIVLHFNGIKGTHDHLVAMMKQALPDVLSKYQTQIDDFFENGPDGVLKGRKLRGLAPDGPIFVVLTELPKPNDPGEPKMAIVLAVKDYEEFLKNILTEEQYKDKKDEGDKIESANFEGKPVYFYNRKGFAVVGPDKQVVQQFTKKFDGLNKTMSKELSAKFLASDVGVFVNMEAVTKEYGNDIKKAKDDIDRQLEPAAAGGEEWQRQLIEMLKKAINPVFQAVEDMHAVLLTVEMRPSGLALHLQSEMKEGSLTANLLQDSRPIKYEELDRMPPGGQSYFGTKLPGGLLQGLGKVIEVLPVELVKDAAGLFKELADAGPVSFIGGDSESKASLTVLHFDDPKKATDAILKMAGNVDRHAPKLKEKSVLKKDAEKHGGFTLHRIDLALAFEKIADAIKGDEDTKKHVVDILKGIVGEKAALWIGTDGKSVVRIVAEDWPTAQKLLDQYSKGEGTAGKAQAFRAARKELPDRTSVLLLLDVTHVVGAIWEQLKPMVPPGLPIPPNWPNMAAKGAPAYVGLAATLQANRGNFDLFITAAAAREFYNVVIKPFVGE